jgi:hypothetical protein
VFGDAAFLASSRILQDEMRGFPLRQPEQRDLSAFYIRETSSDEGFDFVQYRP